MTATDDPARAEWQRLMAAGAQCVKAYGYDRAIGHYEAAVKLAESFGPRDVDLGRALLQLGLIPGGLRACSESGESLFKRVLAILEESLPPDHSDVIACLGGLIDSYFTRWDQKAPLLRRLFAVLERTRGLLDEQTSKAIRDLGHTLQCLHKHAEADQLYTRWLQAAEAAWGPDDRRVIQVVEDMARNFSSEGNFPKAESLYRRALAARERLYDRRHPKDEDQGIALSLFALGTLCAKQGGYEEAERFLRRCMEMSDEGDMAVANALAEVLRKTGREREAFEISNGASLAFYRAHRGD